jgi:hypothetical protein
MSKYDDYLASPGWQKRRAQRLVAAGYCCEFREYVVVDIKHDHYADRCRETSGLQVHHLNYERIGAERDDDLEVLCRFHHLVRHVAATVCMYCGDGTVPFDDDAIQIVKQAIEAAGGIDRVDPRSIDCAPGICDHCDHMLND